MEKSAQDIITAELQRGERLIWYGKPPQGIRLRSSDIFLIPVSLLWCGFAFFWEYSVIKTGFILFIIFGIPFVIMGLYVIIGRFFFDSLQREKTYYGLTDQRVLIVSELFGKKTKSLNLKTLTDISKSGKSKASGIITFGKDDPHYSWLSNSIGFGIGSKIEPCFELSDNVNNVYNMILEL